MTAQDLKKFETINRMIMPLTPLAKQKRIATHMNELLKICDVYERLRRVS